MVCSLVVEKMKINKILRERERERERENVYVMCFDKRTISSVAILQMLHIMEVKRPFEAMAHHRNTTSETYSYTLH